MALRVIGAGFGRTGTSTLREALEILGLGPCHHMKDLVADRTKAAPWARLARGETVDWDTVFAGYSSACDWPSSDFYSQLAAHYPNAKVILTLRDAGAWFKSCSNTIFSELNVAFHKDTGNLGQTMRAIATRHFGGNAADRDICIAAFNRRIEEVKLTIPATRLLVYQVAEGWKPLCDFLGKPVPDTPFPLTNTTESWRDTAAKRFAAFNQDN